MSSEYSDQELQNWTRDGDGLSGLLFEDCRFTNCDWQSLSLCDSRLISCTFENCDLSNIDLKRSRFRDVHFKNCKMIGLAWPETADLTLVSFNSCKLDYSQFSGMKLSKTIFRECSLREVDFSSADLSGADLKFSNLSLAQFRQTQLIGADLRGALDYSIDPLRNSVVGLRANLPEAQGFLVGLGIKIENETD